MRPVAAVRCRSRIDWEAAAGVEAMAPVWKSSIAFSVCEARELLQMQHGAASGVPLTMAGMSTPPLIPRRLLFGNPTRLKPGISPDGTRIAYLSPVDGVLNVWMGTVGRDDAAPLTAERERDIRTFSWALDDRHLLYLQDRDGDENAHLYAVDLATDETRDLTPFERVQARVVGATGRAPGQLVVGLNRRSRSLHDAYRVDLATGELALVAENPGFVSWFADGDLRVRGGVAWTPDGGTSILVRDGEAGGDGWRPLHVVGHEDAMTTRPVGFAGDGRSLLVISPRDANASRLLRIDLREGRTEVLFEDPLYDVVRVFTHPDTRRPQVVTVQRERPHSQVLDPALAGDVGRIREQTGGEPSLIGRDGADQVWLLDLDSDGKAGAYYVYDRRRGHADLLYRHRPELEPYALAAMEPFSFRSRDGLTIHGYLSFPPGAGRSDLPAVLDVHGGPWARDIWGFRADVQWLASRGYLCVQVNFRGSTGYGKDFLNAGDR